MRQGNGHIVIEGLDKTGKSTLARFLSERLGMPIKKFSNPGAGEDAAVEYAEFIVSSQACVVDRMHLSEMAYGPVMRGESTVDENVQRVIEGLLAKRGSVGVYCSAEYDDLVARFKADGEDFIKPEDIVAIKNGFDSALSTSTMKWIEYRVGDDMEAIVKAIEGAQ